VREAVLHASVVLDWFVRPPRRTRGHSATDQEGRTVRAAHRIRGEFEAGDLLVVAPPLLYLEILNVAGRRWQWSVESLRSLASSLDNLAFDLMEPDLDPVVRWVARGLTAYDAAYVAVAESAQIPFLTADPTILSVAGDIAERVG
jgi:predicted nucleic acid-binding protein